MNSWRNAPYRENHTTMSAGCRLTIKGGALALQINGCRREGDLINGGHSQVLTDLSLKERKFPVSRFVIGNGHV
jgi:hypothetical protein